MSSNKTRIEHDLLGDFAVPADAYYGVQTARALENFKISGVELRLYPNFIKALAMVKLAAARANFDTGGFRVRFSPRSKARVRKSSMASSTTSSSSMCSRVAPEHRRT
jgi:aspartate ammonia-lyase